MRYMFRDVAICTENLFCWQANLQAIVGSQAQLFGGRIHLLPREAGLPAFSVFRQVRAGRRVFHEARSVMPCRPALPPITCSFYLRSDLRCISEDGILESEGDKAPVAMGGTGSRLRL